MQGDGGDDDSGLTSEGASEPAGGAVVEGLLPAVLDDELRQDDGQRQLGSLGASASM
jgi:hypothetical protein